MHLLELQDGSFSYPGQASTFHGVSFELDKGEIFTILGPNGAGKSSLLSCLIGLNKLDGGELLLNGELLSALSRKQIAKVMGFVPQSLDSVFAYSVMEYVVMGRAPYISSMRRPSDADYALAAAAIEQMGVKHLAKRSFSALSGGERQQVAIARILVQDPDLILLDEPTSALDFGNQVKVVRMVRQLSEQGYSVVMTTHNPDHAVMLGGTVGVMDSSGSLTVGEADKIIDEDFLSEIYQVEVKISYVEKVNRSACLAVF